MVKDIPFFKDRNMEDSAVLEIVNAMRLKNVPANKYVIEYGDVGHNFYLVLHGHVNISIPDPNGMDAFKQVQRDIA